MKKKIGGALIRRLPEFKTVVAFVVLTLFKLPDPGATIYVQSLLKFPTWGVHERSKSPPYPVVNPLGQNIESCIRNDCLEKNEEKNTGWQKNELFSYL